MPDRNKVHHKQCEIIDDDGASSNRKLTDEIIDSVDYGKIGKAVGDRLGEALKKGVNAAVDGIVDNISKRRKK